METNNISRVYNKIKELDPNYNSSLEDFTKFIKSDSNNISRVYNKIKELDPNYNSSLEDFTTFTMQGGKSHMSEEQNKPYSYDIDQSKVFPEPETIDELNAYNASIPSKPNAPSGNPIADFKARVQGSAPRDSRSAIQIGEDVANDPKIQAAKEAAVAALHKRGINQYGTEIGEVTAELERKELFQDIEAGNIQLADLSDDQVREMTTWADNNIPKRVTTREPHMFGGDIATNPIAQLRRINDKDNYITDERVIDKTHQLLINEDIHRRSVPLLDEIEDINKLVEGYERGYSATGVRQSTTELKKDADGNTLSTEQKNQLEAAIKLNSETRSILEAPSMYDGTNGWANVVKGLAKGASDAELLGFIGEMVDLNELRKIGNKLNVGEELNKEETLLLRAFYNNGKAQQLRSGDTSIGYNIGQGTFESLVFMLEMAGGQAITSAGAKALSKTLAKGVTKGIKAQVAHALSDGVEHWAGKVGQEVAGTLATSSIMPSTYVGVAEDSMQAAMEGDEYDGLDFVRSIADNVLEVGVERSGALIDKGLSYATKLLPNMPNIRKIPEAFGGKFGGIIQNPVSEGLEEGALGGINAARSYNPLYDDESNQKLRDEVDYLFSGKGMKEMLGSVALMSSKGTAINAGRMVYDFKKYSSAKNVLEGELRENGYSDEDVNLTLEKIESDNGLGALRQLADIKNNLKAQYNAQNADDPQARNAYAKKLDQVFGDYKRGLLVASKSFEVLEGMSDEERSELLAKGEKVRNVVENIASQHNSSNGRVQKVTVAGVEGECYVREGNLVVDEQGRVDKSANDANATIIVVDEQGMVHQVGLDRVSSVVGDAASGDILRDSVAILEKMEAAKSEFPTNSIIQDESGRMHQVLGHDENGILVQTNVQDEAGNNIPVKSYMPYGVENLSGTGKIEVGDEIDGLTVSAVREDGTIEFVNSETGDIKDMAMTDFLSLLDSNPEAKAEFFTKKLEQQEAAKNVGEVSGDVVPQAGDTEGAPEMEGAGVELSQLEQDIADADEFLAAGDGDYVSANLKKAQKKLQEASKQKLKETEKQHRIEELKKINADKATAQAEVDRWISVQKAIAEREIAKTFQHQEQQQEAAKNAGEVGEGIKEKWNRAKKIIGNSHTRTLPNGTQISGKYVLVSSGATTPSHDPFNGFHSTEGFPVNKKGENSNSRDYENSAESQNHTTSVAAKYDGQAVDNVPTVNPDDGIVLDGNGRTMAGMLAAANGTDGVYLNVLRSNAANYGFTAEQVDELPNARLVFVLDQSLPYTSDSFAIFNKEDKKSESSTEKAVAVGKSISDMAKAQVLAVIDSYSNLDNMFNSAVGSSQVLIALQEAGLIGQNEVAEMLELNSNGEQILSAVGKQTVEDVLFGALFDSEVIRLVGKDKTIKRALLRASKVIVNNAKLGEYALTDKINNAIKLINEARRAKLSLSLFLRQTDMFQALATERYTAFEILIASEMEAGTEELRAVLSLYNTMAQEMQGGQIDMFSGEVQSQEVIINQILQHYGINESKQTEQGTSEEQRRQRASEVEPIEKGSRGRNGEVEREEETSTTDIRSERGVSSQQGATEKGQRGEETPLDRLHERIAEAQRNARSPKEINAIIREVETSNSLSIEQAQQIAKELKLSHHVTFIESIEDVENPQAKASILAGRRTFGWYNTKSGTVHIYLPHVSNTEADINELRKTILHETAAHKGLRATLGEKAYDEYCVSLFNDFLHADLQWEFIQRAAADSPKYGYMFRGGHTPTKEHVEKMLADKELQAHAADEFLAYTGENGIDKLNLWDRFVQSFRDMLKKIGLNLDISDNEIDRLLRFALKNMQKSNDNRGDVGGKVDNQGNPIDANGALILEEIKSIDELTDDDFNKPTRSVVLPAISANLDAAIGANGKSVIIKKNIFEKNRRNHKELNPEDSKEILTKSLYATNLYGQNQKQNRAYNWVVIHLADKNTVVVLEVNETKDNIEIVGWRYSKEKQLEQLKRQALGEGGLILDLTTESKAAGLSPQDLSSEGKGTTKSSSVQAPEYDDTKSFADNIKAAANKEKVEEGNNETRFRTEVDSRLASLHNAAKFIHNSFKRNKRGGSFLMELPASTHKLIKQKIGRDFDTHSIDFGGVRHAYKNHGEKGLKLDGNSIPLSKEDMELIPYIMVSPDDIRKGSIDNSNRTSIRYIKELSNGTVVVVEKEHKNSPNDMETINMWADVSSNVVNAQSKTDPKQHVRNVIISKDDAAKIRKDAETAIINDVKNSLTKQEILSNPDNRYENSNGTMFRIAYHGSPHLFDKFDHSYMGTGEGAQAFGWGTYLTEVEGIAKEYASRLSDYSNSSLTEDELFRVYENICYEYGVYDIEFYEDYDFKPKDEEAEAEMADVAFEYFTENPDDYSIHIPFNQARDFWTNEELAEMFRDVLNEKFREAAVSRRLYTVDIPEDNGENYLHWEDVVDEETIKKVSNTAISMGYDTDYMIDSYEGMLETNNLTGDTFYPMMTKTISDIDGNSISPQITSQILKEAGFVGISYPAEATTGGRADKARNYVIFDENDIVITDNTRFRQDTSSNITAERTRIEEEAKANGMWLKAPNGKPTNLTPAQWVDVRLQSFKKWFGDWEKKARIEKLRKAKSIILKWGDEYPLNRKDAKQWLKDNVRGEYTNKDTGEKINVSKTGINEVTSHGSTEDAHLKSLISIPRLIEDSIFIDELSNRKNNDKYESYRYYVAGLNIDGVDYTAKIVVGVKNGSKYYDHKLTEIEKGTLISSLNGLSNSVAENQNSFSGSKDTTLLSILQTNSSKVVDENGEPLMVYHGARKTGFATFDDSEGDKKSDAPYDSYWFSDEISVAKSYSGSHAKPTYEVELDEDGYEIDEAESGIYEVFLNIRDPFIQDFEEGNWEGDVYGKVRLSATNEYGDEETIYTPSGKQFFDSFDEAENYARDNGYNDYFIDDSPYIGNSTNGYVEEAMNDGMSDGAILYNVYDSGRYGDSLGNDYIAFHPNQIKSATDNNGEYSKENDDIRFKAEWRDGHTAPCWEPISLEDRRNNGWDTNLREVANNHHNQPDDYFDLRVGARYYGYDDFEGMQSFRAIINAFYKINEGKKKVNITAYRAIPKDIEQDKLLNDDWITFSKQYAVNHGEHRFGEGKYKIIKQTVPVETVWWDGNDINEWGYDDSFIEAVKAGEAKDESGLRFRTTSEINEQFNAELQQQIDGTLPQGHIYSIGMPSDVLRSAGLPNLPIELSAERLAIKASDEYKNNHSFSLDSIKNLPTAVNAPIAVFDSKTKKNAKVVLVELSENGNNFVVALQVRTSDNSINVDVNSVRSLYPKDNKNSISNWINDGLLKWVDKEKANIFFSTQEPNYLAGGKGNNSLSHATKVVQNFQNPTIENVKNDDTRFRAEYDPTLSFAENIKGVSGEKKDASVRFRTTSEINEQFNEELQQQIDGTLPQGHIYSIGMPSDVLRSAGFENLPIELAASRLKGKSKQENHPFNLSEVRNLPKAIQNPIAVFNSKTQAESKVVLTELTNGEKNYIVAIRTTDKVVSGRKRLEVNEIKSLYPKDTQQIIKWITNDKLLSWVDKEKATNWLGIQQSNSADDAIPNNSFNNSDKISKQQYNSADVKNSLIDATKIVQNFQNPTIENVKNDNDTRFRFIGEIGAANLDKAEEATHRLDNLSVAREMETADKDAKAIKLATGWERGADKMWRYEVEDAKIKDSLQLGNTVVKREEEDMIYHNGEKLEDAIDNPELFEAYPELKDVKLYTGDGAERLRYDGAHGYWDSENKRIVINDWDIDVINSILNHELQHAIQAIEGFKRGTNPEIIEERLLNEADQFDGEDAEFARNAAPFEADDQYHRTAGEVEARNVQSRMGMTMQERLNSLAEDTEDVAREDMIFIEDALNAQMRFRTGKSTSLNGDHIYTTADGVSQQLSLFDFEETKTEYKTETFLDKIKKYSKQIASRESLPHIEEGEFAYVERVFTKSNAFSFSSKEKIESIEDVAYIFKQLEDTAVENSFLAMIKNGVPTVVHLSMGDIASVQIVPTAIIAAVHKINPDEIYFVHNHPSGNLSVSNEDRGVFSGLKKTFGDKFKDGIIINLKSGKYRTFNKNSEYDNTSLQQKKDKSAKKIPIYSFSKQVFNKNYKVENNIIGNSKDLAAFISSQRLGERNKLSFLVLNNRLSIVGNFHLPYNDLSNAQVIEDIAKEMSNKTAIFGGNNVVLYGRFPLDKELNELKKKLSYGINMLDCLSLKPEGNYDSAVNENVLREDDVRFRTEVDNRLASLHNAENFINNSLKNGLRDKSYTLQLPTKTRNKIRAKLGRDFNSHKITSNSLVHIEKEHGEHGSKNTANSIPITKKDMGLIPYIMVAPDSVERGSVQNSRESIRYYKHIGNGYVVVLEKEHKNSPNDMETISMWAELSNSGANSVSTIPPNKNVQNVITTKDAAKIRKDAEAAIINDVKNDGDLSFRTAPTSYTRPQYDSNSSFADNISRLSQWREDAERREQTTGVANPDLRYRLPQNATFTEMLKKHLDERKAEQSTVAVENYNNELNRAARHGLINGRKHLEFWFDRLIPIDYFQRYMVEEGAKLRPDNDVYADMFHTNRRVLEAQLKFTYAQKQALIDAVAAMEKEIEAKFADTDYFQWKDLTEAHTKDANKLNGKALTPKEIIDIYLQAKDIQEAAKLKLKDRGQQALRTHFNMTADEIVEHVEKLIPAEIIYSLHTSVKAVNQFALQYMLDGGVIDQHTFDKYAKRKYYVPERGWKERDLDDRDNNYSSTHGQYESTFNAALVKSKGRTSLASSPIPYMLSIVDSSIVLTEKNRTKQAFLRFVLENQEIGIKTDAFKVKKIYAIHKKDENGKTIFANNEPVVEVMYGSPTAKMREHDKKIDNKIAEFNEEANTIAKGKLTEAKKMRLEEIDAEIGKLNNEKYLVAQADDAAIQQRTKSEQHQHIVRVKRDGQEYVIQLKDEKVAKAINREFVTQQSSEWIDEAFRAIGTATRGLSGAMTQYNPEFAVSNLVRDLQTALITNATLRLSYVIPLIVNMGKYTADIAKYSVSHQGVDGVNNLDPKTRKYLELFEEYGVKSGFSFTKKPKELAKSFEKDVKRVKKGNKVKHESKTLAAMSTPTEWSENITRFAMFVTAIEKGKSPQEAAALAKEVTVNFDRKGSISSNRMLGGGMFAFFNASLQGLYTFLRPAIRDKNIRKKYIAKLGAVAVAYFALGYMSTLLYPDAPDEEDYFTDYDRYANFLLGNFRLPATHTLRIFRAWGVNVAQVQTGQKTLGKAMYEVGNFTANELIPQSFLTSLMNPANYVSHNNKTNRLEFDPIGLAREFSPTIAQPIVDVLTNRNFMGYNVYKEPFLTSQDGEFSPLYLAKNNVNPYLYEMSKALLIITGGDPTLEYKDKGFTFNPSKLEHLIRSYGAGFIGAVGDFISCAVMAAQGEEVTTSDIPFVRKFHKSYNGDGLFNKEYWELKEQVDWYNKQYQDKENSRNYDMYQINMSYKHRMFKQAESMLDRIDKQRKRQGDNFKATPAQIQDLMDYNTQWRVM